MPCCEICADAGKYGFVILTDPFAPESGSRTTRKYLESTDFFRSGVSFFKALWELKVLEMQNTAREENDIAEESLCDIVNTMTEEQQMEIQNLKNKLWKEIFESEE